MHVRSLPARKLLMGSAVDVKRYIVLDIGGGTIDVAVHGIERHESGNEFVHEIEGCIGSAYGATVIDRHFEAFLCDLDVPGYPKVFSEMRRNPQVWNTMLGYFERNKVRYDGKRDLQIELPPPMFVHYKERTEKILKCLVKQKSPRVYIDQFTTKLRVAPEICLEWYEPTISSTVELVQSLHAKHQVEALFIVGGFAKCKILHQRLEKEFPALQLVIPEDPGFAIILGAVLYGPLLKAIASRTSHATYGIRSCRPFHAGDDPKKKYKSKKYKADYCHDIFSVFVTKEEELNPSAPYTRTFTPMELDQTALQLVIYATDAKNPKYVTDDGCNKIAQFSVSINSLPHGATAADDNRSVTVKMDFSGPEIFVSAIDNTGKHHNEETIDFLQADQYQDQDQLH